MVRIYNNTKILRAFNYMCGIWLHDMLHRSSCLCYSWIFYYRRCMVDNRLSIQFLANGEKRQMVLIISKK